MSLVQCKICNRRFVKAGLFNHIINEAKSELWKKEFYKEENKLLHVNFLKNKNWVALRKVKKINFYEI